MENAPPRTLEDILADELRALRPGATTRSAPITEHFDGVHGLEQPLSALCISGGGIRSATFGLGALQGLAERGLLGGFDYLSTVSGGGYIGSWLTAWKHRAGGLEKVLPRLRRDAPAPGPGEPDPVRHLREYSSYLAPQRGGFSKDTWTLVATVLRNILLNWLVLVPLLLGALLAPRLMLSLLAFPEFVYGGAILKNGTYDYSAPVLDAVSGSFWVSWVLPGASALLFTVALFNTLRCLPGFGNRGHSEADYRRRILLPLVGAVLSFLAFDSLYFLGSKFKDVSNVGHVVGWAAVPVCGAWLLYVLTAGSVFGRRLRTLFGPLSLAMLAMAAGVGFATWLSTNFLLWAPNAGTEHSWAFYVTFGPGLVLLGYWFGTALFVGLSSGSLADEDREWMSRAMAGVLVFAVAWTGISGLVLVVPHWIFSWQSWAHSLLAGLGAISGWLSSRDRGDARTEAAGERRPPSRWLALATAAAPPLFLALLVVALSITTNALLEGAHHLLEIDLHGPAGEAVVWSDQGGVLTRSQPWVLSALVVVLPAFAWLMARYINVNTFSLHGMYRDRLVRAYLGASNGRREASSFTGFAPNDDFPMANLDPGHRPFHVVNLTLNLVSTERLDWQQRKARSFTVTPQSAGAADLGFRPAAGYGGEGGITLGTAVAISGAAASPSMGYHSSTPVGFIMTLFNARLGAWLGNPGFYGDATWADSGPRRAVRSLLREALGLTSDQSEYVYLSDGGHFENLGLYEMVRRRCRSIVVLDAGADPAFSLDDLGNALRKIRIDFKIPIEFGEGALAAVSAQRRRFAVGTIRYSAADGACPDGQLLYLKPMRKGNETPDVESYGKAHPTFPHQTTADQFFDESQTESYRMLGLLTIEEVCRGFAGGGLEELFAHLGTAPAET